MAFTQVVWYDAPNPLTPLSAANLNDLEARIAAATVQADAFNLQPAVRAANSANISLATSGTLQTLTFDTNRFDSDSQHFTSAANLTGTVTKTAGSANLVGVGTLFTTQLSIGQVIDVPGTVVERRVVTSITDDTHLTVTTNYANTAGGQTAVRNNSAIVARTAGVYNIGANVTFAANATGRRQVLLQLNGATPIGDMVLQAVTDAAVITRMAVNPPPYKLAQWDYVEALALQASGGALNVVSEGSRSPEFGMFRVGAG